MFNNPLRKYQSGGSTQSAEQALYNTFEKASEILGVSVDDLYNAINKVDDPEVFMQAMESLESKDKDVSSAAFKYFSNLLNPNKMRNGGKVKDFVCKHAKGSKVNCGCGGFKVKMENGDNVPKVKQKVKKGQFGMSVVSPSVVSNAYSKIENALTPKNKYESEHDVKVIGGLGLPAYISPQATMIEVPEILSYRVPKETLIDKKGVNLIKAYVNKQKEIDAATKAGKFYVEPRPLDVDIDKLYTIKPKEYDLSWLSKIKLTK